MFRRQFISGAACVAGAGVSLSPARAVPWALIIEVALVIAKAGYKMFRGYPVVRIGDVIGGSITVQSPRTISSVDAALNVELLPSWEVDLPWAKKDLSVPMPARRTLREGYIPGFENLQKGKSYKFHRDLDVSDIEDPGVYQMQIVLKEGDGTRSPSDWAKFILGTGEQIRSL